MVSEPVHIHDDSELPRLLEEASEHPVRFIRKGIEYRVSVVDDEKPWTEEDRDSVLAAIDATAGSWSDLDVDKVVDELYEARRLGSRPATRP